MAQWPEAGDTMIWWTARDDLLVLAPPRRNLAAECPVHRSLPPTRELSVPAPKVRRAIGPPAPASDEPAPEPLQLTPAQRPPAGAPDLAELAERARPLMPLGRGALAEALGVKPHWARRVIDTLNTEQPEQPKLRLVAGEDRP